MALQVYQAGTGPATNGFATLPLYLEMQDSGPKGLTLPDFFSRPSIEESL
jgi:hypothetical protein